MTTNLLIYTFRTFPLIEDLEEISKDIVVLGKLKTDISKVENMLLLGKYSMILGIAKTNGTSVFETQGVNKYNKSKILTDEKDRYVLNFPEDGYKNIKINDSFTTSFCNWGMYKISNFIEKENLKILHSFVHIKKNDVEILKDYLRENYH